MTKPFAKKPAASAPAREPGSGQGLAVLLRKELADHFNGNRFLLLFALLVLTCGVGYIFGLNAIRSSDSTTDFLYLSLLTTGGNSVPSFVSFLAFLGPLMGIILGFDAVSRERSQGTLNRLAAQPIYRDAVINGKFLAGFFVIFLTVFFMGILAVAFGILTTGVAPQAEEVARIIAFLLLAVFYIAFWLGLAILLSVWCRHAATAVLACLAVWIFLSFFMSMVASGIANSLYPLTGIDAMANVEPNYTLQLSLNRISPYYLFSEAVTTILDPSVRSISIITMSQLSGAVVGYLPFWQSVLLVWPHLVCMVALTAICFAGSYVSFMRQEIRA